MDSMKENIAGLYHRASANYGQIGPNFFAYAGQHLVEHAGIEEGSQVLDIGAGRGANLFPAAQRVGPHGTVVGIDLAEGMVQATTAEIARQHLPQASMLQMDAENLTFADASFDTLLCGFAIFLFPHLERALSEFFRVLRPGGRIGITIAQDIAALSRWYGEHITAYHERYHFPLSAGTGEGTNYAELPHHLTQAGFSNVREQQEQANFTYTDAQEWWDAHWTHGPRYSLEHMSPEVLAQFKQDVFTRLAQETQPDGIHETLKLRYILADKA